jgi:hypothetical protein
MDTLPKTVTLDELTDALERVHILTGRDVSGMAVHDGKATYPDALARDLFRDVEKNREPLYESGAIYQDAFGETWKYAATFSGKGSWFGIGLASPCSFDVPKRPLRKMKVVTDQPKFNLVG